MSPQIGLVNVKADGIILHDNYFWKFIASFTMEGNMLSLMQSPLLISDVWACDITLYMWLGAFINDVTT